MAKASRAPARREKSRPARAALTRKKRHNRRVRNGIFLVLEAMVLVILVVVLRSVVLPMTRMGRLQLDEEMISSQMNEGVLENETLKNFTTIALFGVDSREGALREATLSDVIMICAINNKTGEIRLCSVYRDTFLNVGDYYTKANAAYSWGGPEQAINMLNKNLDLNITDFGTVGFQAMTDIINELGGVEIDVDPEAVEHLNNYQWTMARDRLGRASLEETVPGVDFIPLTQGGYQTLDGLQATAYCRVRYLSGGDMTRAQHQREVLQAMFNKAKQSPAKVQSVAEKLFDEVYTSYELSEVVGLAAGVLKYDFAGQAGFPNMEMLTMGMIGPEGSCIVPVTLESNVQWLHAVLFDEQDYEVSPTVKEYSLKIQENTAPYL